MREQVVDGMRPLLAPPVEHLLETHGGPFDRAALARALLRSWTEAQRVGALGLGGRQSKRPPNNPSDRLSNQARTRLVREA
jgi:hypothetical protein